MGCECRGVPYSSQSIPSRPSLIVSIPCPCSIKAFLESVTPEEWFEGLAAEREGKKAALRAEWQGQCDAIAGRKAEAAAARQKAEHDMHWARTQQQFERAERAARAVAADLNEAMAEQVCFAQA